MVEKKTVEFWGDEFQYILIVLYWLFPETIWKKNDNEGKLKNK